MRPRVTLPFLAAACALAFGVAPAQAHRLALEPSAPGGGAEHRPGVRTEHARRGDRRAGQPRCRQDHQGPRRERPLQHARRHLDPRRRVIRLQGERLGGAGLRDLPRQPHARSRVEDPAGVHRHAQADPGQPLRERRARVLRRQQPDDVRARRERQQQPAAPVPDRPRVRPSHRAQPLERSLGRVRHRPEELVHLRAGVHAHARPARGHELLERPERGLRRVIRGLAVPGRPVPLRRADVPRPGRLPGDPPGRAPALDRTARGPAERDAGRPARRRRRASRCSPRSTAA